MQRYQRRRTRFGPKIDAFNLATNSSLKETAVVPVEDRQATDVPWICVFFIANILLNVVPPILFHYGKTYGTFSSDNENDNNDTNLPQGKGYWAIAAVIPVALVSNFIYIKLMSSFPKFLSMCSIIFFEVLWILGIGVMVYAMLAFPKEDGSKNLGLLGPIFINLLIFIVLNAILFCFFKHYQIGVAIVDCAADFYNDTLRILLYTFQTMIFVLLITGTTGLCAYYWQSLIKNQEYANLAHGLMIVVFVLFVFMMTFFQANLSFVYMYATATYYFSSQGDLQLGSAQVQRGIKLSWSKHLGSIVFATVLTTLIKLLKDAVEGNGENSAINVVNSCILNCAEGVLEMFEQDAFAMLAISGDPFCKSAWNGFMLNLRHLIKFIFARMIAQLVIGLGTIAIISLNGGVAFLLAKYAFGEQNATILLIASISGLIVGMIITNICLGGFHDAIIATLMCVAIDMDFNNGMPKHGSASFQTNLQLIFDKPDQTSNQGQMYQAPGQLA